MPFADEFRFPDAVKEAFADRMAAPAADGWVPSEEAIDAARAALRLANGPSLLKGTIEHFEAAVDLLAEHQAWDAAMVLADRMAPGPVPRVHSLVRVANRAAEVGETGVVQRVFAEPMVQGTVFAKSAVVVAGVVAELNRRGSSADATISRLAATPFAPFLGDRSVTRELAERFGMEAIDAYATGAGAGIDSSGQGLVEGVLAQNPDMSLLAVADRLGFSVAAIERFALSYFRQANDDQRGGALAEQILRRPGTPDSDAIGVLVQTAISSRDLPGLVEFVDRLQDHEVPSHLWGSMLRFASDSGDERQVRVWGFRYTSLPTTSDDERRDREVLVGGCAAGAASHPGEWRENSYRQAQSAVAARQDDAMERADLSAIRRSVAPDVGDF